MRRLFVSCLCGTVMLASTGFMPEAQANSSRIPAHTEALFDACMQRCARNDSLGVLTREGCLKGCAEARRQFPLRDETFRSMARCISELDDIEINRDLRIEDGYAWCNDYYTHLHKRKGCKDAFKAYWEAATTNNVCYGRSGSVAGQPVIHDTPAFSTPPAATTGRVVSTPLAPPKSVTPPARATSSPKATQAPKSTKPAAPKASKAKGAKAAPKNQATTTKDAPMPGGERYPGQNGVAPEATPAAPASEGKAQTSTQQVPTAKTGPVLVTPTTVLPSREASGTEAPVVTQATPAQVTEMAAEPVVPAAASDISHDAVPHAEGDPEAAPEAAPEATATLAVPEEVQPEPASTGAVAPPQAPPEAVQTATPASLPVTSPAESSSDASPAEPVSNPAVASPATPPPMFPVLAPPAPPPASASTAPTPGQSLRTPDVLQGIGGNINTPPSYLPLDERSLVNPTPLPAPGS